MEYADGGNLSQCIDDLKRQGVSLGRRSAYLSRKSNVGRSVQVSSQWRTSAFTAATAHASVTQSDGFRTHFALTPCVRCQVRGMAEADARKLFQQLLVALEACHARGVANRDIKVRRRLAFQERVHTFLLGKDNTSTTLGDTAIPCFRVDIREGL